MLKVAVDLRSNMDYLLSCHMTSGWFSSSNKGSYFWHRSSRSTVSSGCGILWSYEESSLISNAVVKWKSISWGSVKTSQIFFTFIWSWLFCHNFISEYRSWWGVIHIFYSHNSSYARFIQHVVAHRMVAISARNEVLSHLIRFW